MIGQERTKQKKVQELDSTILQADRIVVLGPTGAGKTTLAKALSSLTNLPVIELDAFNWNSDWSQANTETFRSRVTKAVAGERWITDGHYPQAGDIVWTRSEMMVWLDYNLWTILPRLFKRQAKTLVHQERLWNGNVSRGWDQFKPRNFISLLEKRISRIRRCLREQRELEELLKSYPHLNVVHLRSPKETKEWLERLRPVVTLMTGVVLALC